MSSTEKDNTITEIALAFYRKQNEELNNFVDDEALKEIVEEQLKPIIRKWLEQKQQKPNYLTKEELTKLSKIEVNLQVVLGLQTCKTKADVMELLDDIRIHERYLLLGDLSL